MNYQRTLAAGLLLFWMQLLAAQADFRPGYIITLDQQQISVLVKDRGELENSRICIFKSGEDAGVQEYDPAGITGYGFDEGSYYLSKSVSLDEREELLFLECLVEGTASLYSLRNKAGELYFLEKEGSDLMLLDNPQLLKAIFSDCMELQSSTEKVQLNRRSLKSIACRYNECVDSSGSCATFGKNSRLRFRMGPVIGYSTGSISIHGDEPFNNFDFSRSNDFAAGLVFHLVFNEFSRFSMEGGAELGSSSSYQAYWEDLGYTSYYYDARMQGMLTRMHLGARYDLGRGRIRPGLGGGLLLGRYLNHQFVLDHWVTERDEVWDRDWEGDIGGDTFYGAYIRLGVDADLNSKLTLIARLSGGYAITNPAVFMRPVYGQSRISSKLVPLSISLGILF